MNHWLVKSPYRHHSWSAILFAGMYRLHGIRNYQSRNNLRDMSIGDRVLFYSSTNGRKLFGVLEVIKEAYQDSSTKDSRWVSCDFKPILTFPIPLSISQLRDIPGFSETTFFRQPRVSVIKLSKTDYDNIISASKIVLQD